MAEEQDKDRQERQRLYDRTRDDLLKRQLSNSENADRAILTVSAAALGFSLAFIKDVVKLSEAEWLSLLYVSWLSFALATVCTLLSFFSSQRAIVKQLTLAERYYLLQDEQALNVRPKAAVITEWLNGGGAFLFVLGLVATCLFVSVNLVKDSKMANRVSVLDGASIPSLQRMSSDLVIKGATIPAMQPAQPQGGATIPTMQKPAEPPPSSGGSNGK